MERDVAFVHWRVPPEAVAPLLPPGLALPHVKSGKLKAVGLTSPGRSTLVTDCACTMRPIRPSAASRG